MSVSARLKFDRSLEEELAAVQAQIRSAPQAPHLRVYLFQLLALLGDWQRAVTQLQVCAQLDAAAIPMAQTYREAVRCELLREAVHRGERSPQVLGEPPAWIGLLIDAQQKLAQGQVEPAAALRAQAFEQAETSAGALDGQRFEWLADADGRYGPVCEAYVNGQYYWIPFERIARITVEAPADLRDLVWAPAQILLRNGGECVSLIPTRYPGSQAGEDALRTSRKTVWEDKGHEIFVGQGQRMWATDMGEYALLDVRSVVFDAPEAAE